MWDSNQQLRKQMVEKQIKRRGISDPRVLQAFEKVPREQFVPEHEERNAYGDHPLPIGNGQTISQPYIVALMTEALAPKEDDIALEIGTGSGYQTAILAELVEHVYSLERVPKLAEQAQQVLQKLNYTNITIQTTKGELIPEENLDINKIIVTAAATEVPSKLTDQLPIDGKLVIPVGDSTFQELFVITNTGSDLHYQNLGGCRFVPLQ